MRKDLHRKQCRRDQDTWNYGTFMIRIKKEPDVR